jgi:hypothetical protein
MLFAGPYPIREPIMPQLHPRAGFLQLADVVHRRILTILVRNVMAGLALFVANAVLYNEKILPESGRVLTGFVVMVGFVLLALAYIRETHSLLRDPRIACPHCGKPTVGLQARRTDVRITGRCPFCGGQVYAST